MKIRILIVHWHGLLIGDILLCKSRINRITIKILEIFVFYVIRKLLNNNIDLGYNYV